MIPNGYVVLPWFLPLWPSELKLRFIHWSSFLAHFRNIAPKNLWIGATWSYESHFVDKWYIIGCHCLHDDVIKYKLFPRYWPFVRVIHRSPMNSPHKGHWGGAWMFSLICAWMNGWVNNHESGYLRHHLTHYDITVMKYNVYPTLQQATYMWFFSLHLVYLDHITHKSFLMRMWSYLDFYYCDLWG